MIKCGPMTMRTLQDAAFVHSISRLSSLGSSSSPFTFHISVSVLACKSGFQRSGSYTYLPLLHPSLLFLFRLIIRTRRVQGQACRPRPRPRPPGQSNAQTCRSLKLSTLRLHPFIRMTSFIFESSATIQRDVLVFKRLIIRQEGERSTLITVANRSRARRWSSFSI